MIFLAFSRNLEEVHMDRPSDQSLVHVGRPIKICLVSAKWQMEASRNFDRKWMWTVQFDSNMVHEDSPIKIRCCLVAATYPTPSAQTNQCLTRGIWWATLQSGLLSQELVWFAWWWLYRWSPYYNKEVLPAGPLNEEHLCQSAALVSLAKTPRACSTNRPLRSVKLIRWPP